jgi:hypothetical protein
MKQKILCVEHPKGIRYYANFNLEDAYIECHEQLLQAAISAADYSMDDGHVLGFDTQPENLPALIRVVDTVLEEATGVKPSHV